MYLTESHSQCKDSYLRERFDGLNAYVCLGYHIHWLGHRQLAQVLKFRLIIHCSLNCILIH